MITFFIFWSMAVMWFAGYATCSAIRDCRDLKQQQANQTGDQQ